MLDYRSTSEPKVQRSAVGWINTRIKQASLWEGEFLIWLNLFFYNKLKNQHNYSLNNALMNNTHLNECHESKMTLHMFYIMAQVAYCLAGAVKWREKKHSFSRQALNMNSRCLDAPRFSLLSFGVCWIPVFFMTFKAILSVKGLLKFHYEATVASFFYILLPRSSKVQNPASKL